MRNLKFNSPTDFEEAAHLSTDGTFDMYEIMKALYDIGFEGPVRPDHGRMIWDEVAMRVTASMTEHWRYLLKRTLGSNRERSKIVMQVNELGLKTENSGKAKAIPFRNSTEQP